MHIAQKFKAGYKAHERKAQEEKALDKLKGKARTDLDALVDVLGSAHDGAKIVLRNAFQTRKAAQDVFADRIAQLAQTYLASDDPAAVVIMSAVNNRNGGAVRNSRNLVAAIRTLSIAQKRVAAAVAARVSQEPGAVSPPTGQSKQQSQGLGQLRDLAAAAFPKMAKRFGIKDTARRGVPQEEETVDGSQKKIDMKLGALADSLESADDGAKVVYRKPFQTRKAAEKEFDARMHRLIRKYEDSADGNAKEAAIVIRNLRGAQQRGVALGKTGNLAKAIRVLADAEAKEAAASRARTQEQEQGGVRRTETPAETELGKLADWLDSVEPDAYIAHRRAFQTRKAAEKEFDSRMQRLIDKYEHSEKEAVAVIRSNFLARKQGLRWQHSPALAGAIRAFARAEARANTAA